MKIKEQYKKYLKDICDAKTIRNRETCLNDLLQAQLSSIELRNRLDY